MNQQVRGGEGKVYQNAMQVYQRETKMKEKDFVLLGQLKEEYRELWWLRLMLKRSATRKNDILSYQDIMGHTQLTKMKLPKNVLHLLHFFIYISTTENETRENMVLLNGLKDRTNDNYIVTVKNINHVAII